MDVATVGLPLAGKTAVFRALTAGHGSTAVGQEALGVVKAPDERLERLAALVKAKKVTPLELRLHDLPPLFERSAGPSGAAAETLARADALLHVVRDFDRPEAPHPKGSVDPERDVRDFDADLMLFDTGVVERRLEKLDITVRSAPAAEREVGEREQALLRRVKALLDGEKPLRNEIADAADLKALANYGLLSLKPLLLALNIGEDRVSEQTAIAADFRSGHSAAATRVTALCAKLEAELAELAAEEAAEFRREMGAAKGATESILDELRALLGLVTFFTIGEKESRAWTVPAGATALQAAGRIHTDIERGFIRAEVIGWEKLLEFGTHVEARKHGQLRQEGKAYVVQEGDVINVLFNV